MKMIYNNIIMTHQPNKHFNTYKEGLDLVFLREYCMEHGERRTFLRGETLEEAGEPAQWVAFVERGCFKYMVHNDEEGKDVSVSAMQPCSASFNSLPLPREYNITNMTAAKRYESVWNAFLNELPHNPTTTLTSFLKRCNVRQGRMKRWMENNGLSVKEAKKRLRDCQHDGIGDPMSPLSEDSGSLFLPMATDKPAPRSESCDILSGVSLTFPDGTQVNIKRGSAQAVMSFLKLYQREDLPCLD